MVQKINKYFLNCLIMFLFILISASFAAANNWENIKINNNTIDYPRDITAVDLDEDGYMDFIASLSHSDKLEWYKNQGNDTYLNFTLASIAFINHIETADFDGDGDIDIVSTSETASQGLQLYTNDGNESFSVTVLDEARTAAIDIFDFDGDGDIDIVSGLSQVASVLLWLNNGDGSFTKIPVAVPDTTTYNILIFDLDNDGDNDIIHNTVAQVVWLENDGSNTEFSEHILMVDDDSESPYRGIAAGLLDNDINNDIAVITSREVWLLINDGSESFTISNITAVGVGAQGYEIIIEDLDNDGDNDIIFTNDYIAWLDNDGEGNFIQKTIYNPSSSLNNFFVGYIDSDDSLDIAISGGISLDELRWFRNLFVAAKCDFPLLFCDTFNYVAPMSTRGWQVYEFATVINRDFSPINNKLNLEQEAHYYPYHETDAFPVSYQAFPDGSFNRHFESPVFSSEFKLTISAGGFKYAAYEKQFLPTYVIKAENITENNISWFYQSQSKPSVQWTLLCQNCTTINETYDMKINTYFSDREDYPFNSSITYDHVDIYAGSIYIGEIPQFITNRTRYLMQYEIIKEDDYRFIIDDYFVMVGTDKYTGTSVNYFEQLYETLTNETLQVGTGESNDLIVATLSIYEDMGLKSTASRVMAGIFLMFLLAVFIIGAFIANHVPVNSIALIAAELFFMIFLVYIKLLPIWIPIVLALIGAGIGAVIFKMGSG